jgi:hypothetical protein
VPFSLGPNQLGECMRCGGKYLASQLQMDGRNPRLLVCPTCWDPAHPQERPFVPNDVEGLPRHPIAPEILPDVAPVLTGEATFVETPPVVSDPVVIDTSSLLGVVYGYSDGVLLGSQFGTIVSGGTIEGSLISEVYYDSVFETFTVVFNPGTPTDLFIDVTVIAPNATETTFARADATLDQPGGYLRWTWDGAAAGLIDPEETYQFVFTLTAAGEEPAASLTWERAQTLKYIVTEYEIYRALGSAGAFALIDTLEVERDGATDYAVTHPSALTDEGLTVDTLYRYRVDAITDAGRVLDSNVSEITTEAPPVPVTPEIFDMQGSVDGFGSSVFSFTYDGADGLDTSLSPVMVVFLACRTLSNVNTPPTSISYGNIAATDIQYQRMSATPSSGSFHTALAYIPLRDAVPDDSTVRVDWTGVGLEASVGWAIATVTQVGETSDDFALGLDAQTDVSELAVETIADNDIVLAFGVHVTALVLDYDGYTMIADQSTFTSGRKTAAGYRVVPSAGAETVTTNVDFKVGFACVLSGPEA